MSDNKEMQDQRDRSKVAGSEDYEVRYMAEKMNTTPEMVQLAIKEVGNSREAIEKFLQHMKKG